MSARWWREAALRRSALGVLPTLVPAVVVLVVAALFGARWWWTAGVLAVDRDATSDSTVVALTVSKETPPFVSEATVRFDLAGRPQEARVLLRDHPDVGETFRVRYSVERPSRARVEGSDDGLVLLVLISGSAAVGAAGFAGLRVAVVARRHRRLHRLLDKPATTLRYQRFVDARGIPGLALFAGDGGGVPDVVVPLMAHAPGLATTRFEGSIEVHGEVRDGSHVVPVADGRPLWPLGPALALPSGAMRELVDGARIPDVARGIWPTRRLRDLRPWLPG